MVTPRVGWKAKVKVRLTRRDARYSGGLVAGAKILELFGDAATKLCLRETRGKNEGLLRAYREVEFLRPVYAGDTVEATATLIKIGTRSRTMRFEASKVQPKKVLVCRAVGTVVAVGGTAVGDGGTAVAVGVGVAAVPQAASTSEAAISKDIRGKRYLRMGLSSSREISAQSATRGPGF